MKQPDMMVLDFFGIEVECEAVNIRGLSLIDTKRFKFFKAEISKQKFIVAKYLGEPVGVVQMDSMLSRFAELSGLEVLVHLDSITYSRRTAYMKKGIPFIVRDKQIFVPFLGMSLAKRCDNELLRSESSKLTMPTQLMLLYYLHSDKDTIRLADVNERLAYSRMTLSRSGRELVETELFESYKEGNSIILRGILPKHEIFERLLEKFITPDKFIGYSTSDIIDSSFTYGGADALAHRSILSFGRIPEYASEARDIKVQDDYIDADKAVKIYQWKYDPLLFSDDGIIDPLSIAISLKDNSDERVQSCVQDMLNEFWEKKGE